MPQMTDIGADECLDPALMSACADDPFCALAAAGPPSPFDMSTIDPDLLALYPEHKDSRPAALVPVARPSPPPIEDVSAIAQSPADIAVEDNLRDPPPTKRVRFATLPPRSPHTPTARFSSSASPARVTRAQARKRPQNGPVRGAGSAPTPKKHSALGVAKRTISDGTLVPPSPCARCEWEEAECLVKYPGAACNTCRRRGRKCELVDERVKFDGQRAKDLRAASGSGSGSVGALRG